MNASSLSLAESEADLTRCFQVMVQLRPHLTLADFLERVRRMSGEKYRVAFLTDEAGGVRAVAGFREMETLYAGRTIYVDDLVTDADARSQGYGDQLLDWLSARARTLGCAQLCLDSGTQRVDAHRFYLRKRMKIASFHFVLPLTS